jgi:hypothetical protein
VVIATGLLVLWRMISARVHDCERSIERVKLSIAEIASVICNTRMPETGHTLINMWTSIFNGVVFAAVDVKPLIDYDG